MSNRRKPPAPPEFPSEPDEVDPEDDGALDEADQDLYADPDGEESITRQFFGALGGTGFGDPRTASEPTKITAQLSSTPIHAVSDEGAEQWLIEKRNEETGQADFVGYAPLQISMATFIRRFLDSMPLKGEDPAQFYFSPLDRTGAKIGAPGKPRTTNIPWHNEVLLRVREIQRKNDDRLGLGGGGSNAVVQLLMRQAMEEKQARIRLETQMRQAEEAARRDREAILKERMAHASTLQTDVAAAYERVGAVQKEGFGSILSASEKMSLEREKREEERIRREREDEERRRTREREANDEERRRREDERKEERDRLRAENAAALERVKAEAEARLREIDAKARLEEKKIEAEIEKAKNTLLAEQERIKAEREREDQRRKDEQERRDRLEGEERSRYREHATSMEKIRTDAITAQQQLLASEQGRRDEHMKLMLGLIQERSSASSGLGVIGELLNTLGMTPADAMDKVKGLMGGEGAGLGVTIAQGLFDTVREFVKKIPTQTDEGDDEEEEYEDDEPEQIEEKPQAPQRSPAPERERVPAAARQPGRTLDEIIAEAPDGAAGMAADTAPGPESSAAVPAPQPAVSVGLPDAPAVPIAETRAGREAVESLVERLQSISGDHTVARVSEAIMGGDDVDALVRYVGRVGLTEALKDHAVDVQMVGNALVSLGLFKESPLSAAG